MGIDVVKADDLIALGIELTPEKRASYNQSRYSKLLETIDAIALGLKGMSRPVWPSRDLYLALCNLHVFHNIDYERYVRVINQ